LFEILDPSFEKMIKKDAPLLHLHEGGGWTEGPVYFAEEDYLLFSDCD